MSKKPQAVLGEEVKRLAISLLHIVLAVIAWVFRLAGQLLIKISDIILKLIT